MANEFAVLEGDSELRAALTFMTTGGQNKVMRPAIQEATKLVKRTAQANVTRILSQSKDGPETRWPKWVSTGALRRGISRKTGTVRRGEFKGEVYGRVGYKGGSKALKVNAPHTRWRKGTAYDTHSPAFIAHIIEHGRGPIVKNSVKISGRQPARPFLRPAIEQSRSPALQVMAAKARSILPKIAEEARRQGKRKQAAYIRRHFGIAPGGIRRGDPRAA